MAHGNVSKDLEQFACWLADKGCFLWQIPFLNVQAGWLVSQTLFERILGKKSMWFKGIQWIFFIAGGITITLQNPLVSQFIYNMNLQFPISDLFKVANILVFEAIHLYSFS